jgi:hypothetical protein
MSKVEPKLVIRKELLPKDPFRGRDVRPTEAGAVAETAIQKDDQRRENSAFGPAMQRRVDPPAWLLKLWQPNRAGEGSENLDERLPDIKDSELVRLVVNEMGRTRGSRRRPQRKILLQTWPVVSTRRSARWVR